MHDKFKRRYQVAKSSERVRHQIALEAARRLFDAAVTGDGGPLDRLMDVSEADLYTAKRKAAAVLGHRVRPGDLPSDSEVREELVTLVRSQRGPVDEPPPEPSEGEPLAVMAEHLDRFAIYRLRLLPLETVKQNPRSHPEGDALFHSLQVFERARAARPYDEEFLLAALLHDVGKAIDPSNSAASAAEALRGAVSPRTLWLIENHVNRNTPREKAVAAKARRAVEDTEWLEDLELLREIDELGRVPGAPVGTVDEALAFIQGLENEDYLKDPVG